LGVKKGKYILVPRRSPSLVQVSHIKKDVGKGPSPAMPKGKARKTGKKVFRPSGKQTIRDQEKKKGLAAAGGGEEAPKSSYWKVGLKREGRGKLEGKRAETVMPAGKHQLRNQRGIISSDQT